MRVKNVPPVLATPCAKSKEEVLRERLDREALGKQEDFWRRTSLWLWPTNLTYPQNLSLWVHQAPLRVIPMHGTCSLGDAHLLHAVNGQQRGEVVLVAVARAPAFRAARVRPVPAVLLERLRHTSAVRLQHMPKLQYGSSSDSAHAKVAVWQSEWSQLVIQSIIAHLGRSSSAARAPAPHVCGQLHPICHAPRPSVQR